MRSTVGIPLLPAQAVAEGQGGGGCQNLCSYEASISSCLWGMCWDVLIYLCAEVFYTKSVGSPYVASAYSS